MDGLTGEVHACQLFVAVLGASSYTYAEATLTQTLPNWCGSHERAFNRNEWPDVAGIGGRMRRNGQVLEIF